MKRIVIIFLIGFNLLVCYTSQGQRTIGLFQNTEESAEGYTLFSSDQTTYLIDDCGREVHSWTSTLDPGLTTYIDGQGNLIRPGVGELNISGSGPGVGGVLEKYDWDGNLLWSYTILDSTGIHHHDIEPLPNGNILVIAWEIKLAEEAIQAGANTNTGYWPLVIFEIQPVGSDDANIVWEWHAWDHLVQDFDDTKDNYGEVADHPELLDLNYQIPSYGGNWLHANSIDYNADRDEILISARNYSEIYIIDHSTSSAEAAGHTGGNRGKGGDLLYRWGNPQTYDRGTAEDQTLFLQHDAQWVPSGYEDDGKISIFNNGAGRPSGDITTIDLIDPPIDGNGNYILSANAAFTPVAPEWTYQDLDQSTFFHPNMGGAHRLENGNTFITKSRSGEFLEIDRDGKSVWQYVSPVGTNGPLEQGASASQALSIFRATRYTKTFPGFNGRNLTPRDRIELNPLPLKCNLDLATSTRNEVLLEEIDMWGSLTADYVVINNYKGRTLRIGVINAVGQLLSMNKSSEKQIEIDLSNYQPGIFFLKVTDMESFQSSTFKAVKLD